MTVSGLAFVTTAALSLLVRALWGRVQKNEQMAHDLVNKLHAVAVLVAGDYIKREEFERKLDQLTSKLDGKQDRS